MSQDSAQRLLPGSRLRQARQQQGLSEEEVARRLHMSVTFVRAIEADDYERLPEAAFIKGYMRNYARLVHVPADEVANLFQQMIEEDDRGAAEDSAAQTASRPDADGGSRKLIWVLPVLILLAIGWWLSGDRDPEVREEIEAPAVPEAREEVLEPSLEVQDAEVAPVEPVVDEPVAEAQPDVSQSDAVAVTPDQIRIRFNAPCWVQVLDASGETLFSGQRDQDSGLSLSGMGPFRITFGNGAAVDSLSVNEQSVRIPQSAPGNVVRVTAP